MSVKIWGKGKYLLPFYMGKGTGGILGRATDILDNPKGPFHTPIPPNPQGDIDYLGSVYGDGGSLRNYLISGSRFPSPQFT